MKFEIKSWLYGGVLFALETDSLKLCVEVAVKEGINLDGASLDGARLDGARLDGARLIGARLIGARLIGANLVGANLDGASLVGASLDRANLDRANLDGANLVGARLVGARLDGASLDGARLIGASLVGASLVGASGLDKFPIQIGGHKHWLITTPDGELQIGCHKHSFDYWERNAERIGKVEGYSPLDIQLYKLAIGFAQKYAQLLWNADKKTAKEASHV